MDARHVAIALVLLGGLALAGCTLTSQETSYPEESEVRDQLSSLETLEADVVTETTAGGNQTTVRTHVVRDLETGEYRSTVTDGPSEGMTVVMNESTMQYYEPTSNTVQIIDRPSTGDRGVNQTVETVSTIYERLSDDEDGDGQIGISPAPTVPSTGAGSSSGQTPVTLPIGDNVSVSNAGTGTVDGREVRVVELHSTDEKSLLLNATYYLDEAWHFPLKSTVAVQVGNQTSVATTTYTNVSINDPVDEKQFEFDPPSTATAVDGPSGSFQQFDSHESLVEGVDQSVPDPTLPAGYEFESAEVNPAASGQSVTVVYAGASDSITVTKRSEYGVNLTDDGDHVEVADESGRRISIGTNEAVVWTCEENTYSVVSSEDGPSIEEIAQSVGCT